MSLIHSRVIVPFAVILVCVLFWFRPGGIEGPRPDPVQQQGKGFDHSLWTQVLSRIVQPDGTVDYAALRTDSGDFDRYLGMLRGTSPGSAPHRFRSSDDRLAYYLNAYNAFVVAAIRDHCPIKNVQEEYLGGGFFWRISFLMGGEPITLTDLESTRMRKVMQRNPAVHFARVGGARGFLPLRAKAYEGKKLKSQLDAVLQRALADQRIIRRKKDELVLSEIFKWYKSDFGKPMDWIRRYGADFVSGGPKVTYLQFDWSLNGRCP